MKRRDVSLPDGWRVRPNSHVQVLDHAGLTPADLPVHGGWRVLDRSPDGWWLYPADDVARRWLAVHGQQAGVQSGCISVHGLRLIPGWLQLTLREA